MVNKGRDFVKLLKQWMSGRFVVDPHIEIITTLSINTKWVISAQLEFKFYVRGHSGIERLLALRPSLGKRRFGVQSCIR